MRPLALLFFLATILTGGSLLADCGDYLPNQLADANCDADSDAAGWFATSGVLSYEAALGVPAGSIRLEAGFDKRGGGPQAVAWLCVDSAIGGTVSVGGALYQVDGPPLSCGVQGVTFSAPGCSGLLDSFSNSPIDSALAEWRMASLVRDIGTAGQSAAIRFECSADESFTLLLDNAYMIEGSGGAPLFFDGFEDADLEHWTTSLL